MHYLRKITTFLVPVVVLIALYNVVNVTAVLKIFTEISPAGLIGLFSISFLMVLVSAMKWQVFLKHLGVAASLLELFKLYLVGYFINLFLPTVVGGDAVRSFVLGKRVGQHRVAAATIMERYTGVVAMLLLGCIAMNFSELATWQIKTSLVLLLIAVVFLAVIARSRAAIKIIKRVPFCKRFVPHLEKLRGGLVLTMQSPRVVIEAYGLSILFHTLTVFNTYCCALAVGWGDPSVKSLFVVLPLILSIGNIPISPQGLGIQEGAFYFFLTRIGATPEQAVGIALILRAKSYVLAVVGGVFWNFRKKKSLPDHAQPREV